MIGPGTCCIPLVVRADAATGAEAGCGAQPRLGVSAMGACWTVGVARSAAAATPAFSGTAMGARQTGHAVRTLPLRSFVMYPAPHFWHRTFPAIVVYLLDGCPNSWCGPSGNAVPGSSNGGRSSKEYLSSAGVSTRTTSRPRCVSAETVMPPGKTSFRRSRRSGEWRWTRRLVGDTRWPGIAPAGTEAGNCIGARARRGYVLVTPRYGGRPRKDRGGGQADQSCACRSIGVIIQVRVETYRPNHT